MKTNDVVIKQSGGIGFLGLLTLLFIGFKLTGYIDWGWLWVLSPLWLSAIIGLVGIVVFFVGCFVIGILIGIVKGLNNER